MVEISHTNSQSVKLGLSGSDSNGLAGMCIRNNTTALCSPCLWEPYSSTKVWIFPSGDGAKTVYVEYQGCCRECSPVYSHSIMLDATAPVDGVVSAVPGDSQVFLNWSGFSDARSGITTYALVFSTIDHPPIALRRQRSIREQALHTRTHIDERHHVSLPRLCR